MTTKGTEMSEQVLACPCCGGKGTVENQRERLLAELKAVYINLNPEDQQEVEFYAAYLKTRRLRR